MAGQVRSVAAYSHLQKWYREPRRRLNGGGSGLPCPPGRCFNLHFYFSLPSTVLGFEFLPSYPEA